MRIAQVAPLHESVPPRLYGGTERIVSYLTEELVRMGHEVTLFSSGDSLTSARHVPVCESALRLNPQCIDRMAHHILMLELVRQQAAEFDLIHFHIDYLHFPLTRALGWTSLTTYHGRLDIPDLHPLFREYLDLPAVSISDAQRRPLPWINWMGTIYHGIPDDVLDFNPHPDEYLVFFGRISPEKGVERAIELAQHMGRPLKIAAKVRQQDRAYFEYVIRPRLKESGVDYLGEIGDTEKQELLGGASALLFPIEWPEPFGIVMIEAMACGTPVVAHNRGSVSEVIADGVSGAVIDPKASLAESAVAVERAMSMNRWAVRQEFERRFTASRMAADYVQIYERLVQLVPEMPQTEVAVFND